MGTGYDGYTTKRRIIQSRSGNDMKVDSIGMIAADTPHHRKTDFDKEYFISYEWATVPASSVVTLTIATNTKYPYGSIRMASDAEFSYAITLSTATVGLINGTQIYQFNVNRGMNNSRSVASFYFDDTGTSGAGELYKTLELGHVGASSTEKPKDYTKIQSSDEGAEWLLDSEQVYNVIITNESVVTAYIIFKYSYCEHDAVESSTTTNYGESATEYDGEHI